MNQSLIYNGKKYKITTNFVAEIYGHKRAYVYEGNIYASRADIIREIMPPENEDVCVEADAPAKAA